MDLIDIGERIREARKSLQMTQTELAAKSESSRRTITQLETGIMPEIGVKMLARIMNAVGLDLRPVTYNDSRPTLTELMAENEESDDAPRMGR